MRWTERAIQVREQFSKKILIRFLIIFALSTALFFSTQNEYLEAVFGLIMIISGAILILFVMVLLILIILKGIKNQKEKKLQSIKTSSKPVKKATTKKTTKKVAKKKTISKKRK